MTLKFRQEGSFEWDFVTFNLNFVRILNVFSPQMLIKYFIWFYEVLMFHLHNRLPFSSSKLMIEWWFNEIIGSFQILL